MNRIIAGVLIACAGFLVHEAIACSCAPPPPPQKALEQATAVFAAKVIKIEEAGLTRKVTLKVERWWKGGDANMIVVSTAKDSAACGYNFQPDGKYLVYAHAQKNDPMLHVSLCSRTQTMGAAAKVDLKEIGEGKAARN